MYKIFQDTAFYICRYNFDLQRWEQVKKLANEQELISYISSHFHNEVTFWDEDDHPKGFRVVNALDERMNYTGKDTCGVSENGFYYFRDTMIVDCEDRIINYRDYLDRNGRYPCFRYLERKTLIKSKYSNVYCCLPHAGE